MGKKGKKANKRPTAASVAAPAASADAPAVAEAEAEPVDPAPAEDSSSDSGSEHESGTTGESDEPREEAPSRSRPPAVEEASSSPADRENDAGSSDTLAMELASLRARCLSLEEEAKAKASAHAEALRSQRAEKDALARSHLAELEQARESAETNASSAKSELATMRVMSSAQRAKIDALSDTVEELQETLERFQRERDETQNAATAEAVALALADADAKHEEALKKAVENGREALRRAYVVHAAAKTEWATEKIGLVETRGDAAEQEIAEAAKIAKMARAAVGSGSGSGKSFFPLTEDDKDDALASPGAALRALFAATTPSRARVALANAEADARMRERENSAEGEAQTPSGKEPAPPEPTLPSGGGETRGDDESSESGSSASSASSDGSDASDSSRSAAPSAEREESEGKQVAVSPEPSSPPRPSVGDLSLADLLDDAMEDEISASVARGYCVDNETGAVIVGASAIVEKVIAKYRGDAEETSSRRKLSPLFSPSNAGAPNAVVADDVFARVAIGQGPAFDKAVREANGGGVSENATSSAYVSQSDVFALRLERERNRRERSILIAELQQSRAELERAKLDARSPKTRDEAVDFTTSVYEKEEGACVRRLALASEVRSRELELSLKEARKKAVPPSALRAVLAELGELRARLSRVREAQETSARLIAPTVASALACLRLSGPESR